MPQEMNERLSALKYYESNESNDRVMRQLDCASNNAIKNTVKDSRAFFRSALSLMRERFLLFCGNCFADASKRTIFETW